MTSHKSFKQRVRTRMDKTGESYTAARAQLLPRDQEPDVGPTGRPYSHWFAELDEWGAIDRSHKEIAAWLMNGRGIKYPSRYTASSSSVSQIFCRSSGILKIVANLPNMFVPAELRGVEEERSRGLETL